jgi:hypothetical protein
MARIKLLPLNLESKVEQAIVSCDLLHQFVAQRAFAAKWEGLFMGAWVAQALACTWICF